MSPQHYERCCNKCRAVPGVCGLQRVCPCHSYRPSQDYEPDPRPYHEDDDEPLPPFPRPVIKPRPTQRFGDPIQRYGNYQPPHHGRHG